MSTDGCVPALSPGSDGRSRNLNSKVLQGASGSSVSPGRLRCSSPRRTSGVAAECCPVVSTPHPMPSCIAGGLNRWASASARRNPAYASRYGSLGPSRPQRPCRHHQGNARVLSRGVGRPARWPARIFVHRIIDDGHASRFPTRRLHALAGAAMETNGKGRPSQEGKWHTQWTRIHQMEATQE